MNEPRYINANELKDTLDYYISEAGWTADHNEALTWVRDEFIDAVKTADVAPVVHGHWENIENAKNTIRCSNCGHIRELKHFSEIIKRPKLCEMCGAKMESEDSGND